MMTTTFDEVRLQPGFTFRVIEAVKRTKIQSAPYKPALPFGISATGIMIALMLSMTIPQSPLYPIGQLIGSALPSQTQVADDGLIPVDTIEITEITILTSEKGDFGQKPKEPRNTFAPAGQAGTWTKKTDTPTARWATATSGVEEKIYVIGGFGAGGRVATVEAYDLTTNTWTQKTDMPSIRSHLSTSAVNGKIYAIGGRVVAGVFSAVEEYNPATDRWTKKADMPTARTSMGISAVNGKIYAIGGANAAGTVVSIVEEYNPATDRWTKKADMPTARASIGISVVNGKIYAIGGKSTGSTSWSNFSTVEMYDPETDTWTQKADMPTRRYSLSAAVVDGKIYAIGGSADETFNVPLVATSTVEVYDQTTDTWAQDTDMLTARTHFSMTTVNGRIYAVGGAPGFPGLARPRTIVTAVEEFDIGVVSSVDPRGKLTTTWGEIKAKN
jgi:N-acetylneuraminic acid mutarotase